MNIFFANMFKIYSPQVIYQHILTSLIEFHTYHIISKHCVIQTNRWAGSLFWTSKGMPCNIQGRIAGPMEALIKADWAKFCNGV